MMKKFHFLVEEDFGTNNNFTIYIPELRMSACGDTLDEAHTNAVDVIRASFETKSHPKLHKSSVVEVELDLVFTGNLQPISKAI